MKNEIKELRTILDRLEKSIEQSEPQLEMGKSYRSKRYPSQVVINRQGDVDNYGFTDGGYSVRLGCCVPKLWQEIQESEAIELLKEECVRRYGENWRDVKIKQSVGRFVDSMNSGKYDPEISISEIYNRNGLIFKDGVWAEKLEEPKIKKGQMIWVRDTCDAFEMSWEVEKFVEFKKDGRVTTRDSYDEDMSWDEYSITNPYSDSIEARAIKLLKELYESDEDDLDYRNAIVDTRDFLKEVESYK